MGHGDAGRGHWPDGQTGTCTCHQDAYEVHILERMGSSKPMLDTSLMQAQGVESQERPHWAGRGHMSRIDSGGAPEPEDRTARRVGCRWVGGHHC